MSVPKMRAALSDSSRGIDPRASCSQTRRNDGGVDEWRERWGVRPACGDSAIKGRLACSAKRCALAKPQARYALGSKLAGRRDRSGRVRRGGGPVYGCGCGARQALLAREHKCRRTMRGPELLPACMCVSGSLSARERGSKSTAQRVGFRFRASSHSFGCANIALLANTRISSVAAAADVSQPAVPRAKPPRRACEPPPIDAAATTFARRLLEGAAAVALAHLNVAARLLLN